MLQYIFHKIVKKLRLSAIKNSKIHKSARVESGSSFINSTMDRYSFCGYDCTILNTEIGSFCSIASNVKIGGVAHPVDFVSTSPVFLSHKDSIKQKFANHNYLPKIITKIEHDVWIGEGAIIKAGITIGIGAVIGMGSVVTKDVSPYEIVGGNPAKNIRFRFTQEIIDKLLASKWWDFDDTLLKKYGVYFNDPKSFLKEYSE